MVSYHFSPSTGAIIHAASAPGQFKVTYSKAQLYTFTCTVRDPVSFDALGSDTTKVDVMSSTYMVHLQLHYSTVIFHYALYMKLSYL